MSLHSFLTRLIWLSALPLLLLAGYLAFDRVSTLQAQRDQEAGNLARNFAVAIDRHLGARVAALQVLAASPLVDDPPRLEELYREAQGFRESFGSHVVLADLSTQMLFNTRVPFGSKLPKLPVVKGHAAAPAVIATGQPAVGDMFFGPIAKEPLVGTPALPGGEGPGGGALDPPRASRDRGDRHGSLRAGRGGGEATRTAATASCASRWNSRPSRRPSRVSASTGSPSTIRPEGLPRERLA